MVKYENDEREDSYDVNIHTFDMENCRIVHYNTSTQWGNCGVNTASPCSPWMWAGGAAAHL